MDAEAVLDRLRSEKGIVRAEIVPDELMQRILAEESTVTAALGSMPVINTGLDVCMDRDVRICVFEDETAWHPRETSMRLVDSEMNVLGHDIPLDEALDYASRDDVVMVSDDFVMYPDRIAVGGMSMEMLATPYLGSTGWMPEAQSPVIWYPSTSSSEIVMRFYGHPSDGTATGILSFNLG